VKIFKDKKNVPIHSRLIIVFIKVVRKVEVSVIQSKNISKFSDSFLEEGGFNS
jgi:hypothetical protein